MAIIPIINKLVVPVTAITTAVTGVIASGDGPGQTLASGVFAIGVPLQAIAWNSKFVYGSGGTNATLYLQTSLDGGVNFRDCSSIQFTTASAVRTARFSLSTDTVAAADTDATLAANTNSPIFGDLFRIKLTTTGTYAGGTTINASFFPIASEFRR